MVAGQCRQGRGADRGGPDAGGGPRGGAQGPEDGRWAAAYASRSTATVPPALAAALSERPTAAAAFESLARSERYQLILPLLQALTPRARHTRLEAILTRLAPEADRP
ncbi:YdeI/OmpD-associated family protein [Streptomyces sp. G-G2]|uniref:YdeI/OmpD-associated family protein n=1 Tax=Streptomyces sp. G-G2 TaxID=3046201 RepID=UPI0024B94205|nr:YdeI/OmpD-associated family protein [Streptomyces sp. G-G2]MDJ0380193.1 YdeI/OmpD-associated family protein [Streptomyces sp. G-G2]